nr:immunoglobulin light chain junction region [Macaca mulatta]
VYYCVLYMGSGISVF